jgi:hypothetical protein
MIVKPLGISPEAAAALKTPGKSSKTKADIAHGESVCRGLIELVSILLHKDGFEIEKGKPNYLFDEHTRREMDAAWPDFKVCCELQGHDYHKHKGQFDRDFAKGASAVMQGWKVFYATERQMRTCAPLWVYTVIKQMLERP